MAQTLNHIGNGAFLIVPQVFGFFELDGLFFESGPPVDHAGFQREQVNDVDRLVSLLDGGVQMVIGFIGGQEQQSIGKRLLAQSKPCGSRDSRRCNYYRDALTAEFPRFAGKTSSYGQSTLWAMPLFGQSILPDLVPVALDQRGVASRAESSVTLPVAHVACVDILQAFTHGNLARPHQGGGWCGRYIWHFVIRVKGREVKGDV
jgi:hypothetical protein